jgi:hypothetical protein
MEGFVGNPGSPAIVQAPTILRPLSVTSSVDPRLAYFRKLVIGETVPAYGKLNPNDYVGLSGKSVGIGYQQYLLQLNAEVIRRFVNPADHAKIDSAKQRYERAQAALTAFARMANADWKRKKTADPTLDRATWDIEYGAFGFTAGRRMLLDESTKSYGEYRALATPYPQVARVAEALARTAYGVGTQIALPSSEDDVALGADGWDTYYKTNIDLGMDWRDFWGTDAPDERGIEQASQTSTHYEHRWSAGGSVSYGFFSVGGSASGGTIENHLRAGTQRVKFSFDRLALGTIVRGTWFDNGLVTSKPYTDYVAFDEYWGANGTLPLIPISVVVGRGLKIEIETSQIAHDDYQSWRQTSGNAGFRCGPFRIGGGGSSSTSWGSVTDTSSGSTIRLKDESGQAYVMAVISQKMDDLVSSSTAFEAIAGEDLRRIAENEAAFEERHTVLAI